MSIIFFILAIVFLFGFFNRALRWQDSGCNVDAAVAAIHLAFSLACGAAAAATAASTF